MVHPILLVSFDALLYLFIYLFILHTAWSPKAMAGIERKDNNISSKTDVQKQAR